MPITKERLKACIDEALHCQRELTTLVGMASMSANLSQDARNRILAEITKTQVPPMTICATNAAMLQARWAINERQKQRSAKKDTQND